MVIDLFGDKNNGTTVTAMRTAHLLKEFGNEVRIIAYIPENADADDLKDYKILRCYRVSLPIFDWIVVANGFTFADCDEKEMAEFIKGSDVVHVMLPFVLEAKARKIAKILSIPVTSAYHLQPDSVSYNMHMGHFQPLNALIYHFFDRWLYRYTRTVHTPSETMRCLMIQHHYHSDIHAISNGVSPYFEPESHEKPEELKDKFLILMVGRLSGEKRQDIIIRAIGKSKYNEKIQLILCGQGPNKKHLEKLAAKYLKNPPIFRFCSQRQLKEVINYSDLYIHASDIESEAIACVEAFACGKVPVISDSRFSATNHFALDERSLFRAGDHNSLQQRIDYFIEHPEAIQELSAKYVEYSKEFDIVKKAKALEEMMKLEIERDKEDHRLGRTYYSSFRERRHLKKIAKKIGLENPYIVKKDVFHSSDEFSNKEERKALKKKRR